MHEVLIRLRNIRRRSQKLLLTMFGLFFLGIGIIGYILPGLPGTIFLIIAATLFVRSSDRLYRFVVNNPIFGRQVGDFLKTGAIPLKAKILSIFFMWVFLLISMFLTPYGWPFKVIVLILAIVGTIYIISRPTRKIPVE